MRIDERVAQIKTRMAEAMASRIVSGEAPVLIAASKTHYHDTIAEAIRSGVEQFGENKVQEMMEKWPLLKQEHPEIRLHFIGQLQTNKVADVVSICDMIHTVDREKLAREINKEAEKQGKAMPCLIQVNVGEEDQKGGILGDELADLLFICTDLPHLDIQGLMCVPPSDVDPIPYFSLLASLAQTHSLPLLSMGMSQDFETAIRCGATHIRVGTEIFGKRFV